MLQCKIIENLYLPLKLITTLLLSVIDAYVPCRYKWIGVVYLDHDLMSR